MTIQWRKEMAVDDSIIDEDHKLLIEIINSFEGAVAREITVQSLGHGLKLLKHYAVEHFSREEELQRAAQYPFHQAHAREHRDLVKKLDEIVRHYSASSSEAELATVAKEILDLLKQWLVQHIIQNDLRMRPYVAAMKGQRLKMPSLRSTGPK